MRNIFKPKQHATVKDALVDKMKTVLMCFGGLIVGFMLVHWLTGANDVINATTGELPSQEQTQYDPLKDPSSVEYVLNQHKADCWTGDQPAKADLPGAAIVQFPNGMVQYTTVHWKVSAAFDEALARIGDGDKMSKKLDPIALCK